MSLQIFEILDRVEILYPRNTLYSDLRKVISSDDKFALFRILQKSNSSALLEGLRKYKDDPNFNVDCFSRGQLKSKQWVVTEVEKLGIDLGVIFLCAGWYATLATMLFESQCQITKIRSFDIDPSCIEIAEIFNKQWFINQWQFKALTENIMDIDYNSHTWQFWSTKNNRMSYPIMDTPNTIINTSCEHIENFKEWYEKIPSGKLVILQTNNYFEIEDHINCSDSLESFAAITPMKDVLYEGELELSKYTRFMRIGIK